MSTIDEQVLKSPFQSKMAEIEGIENVSRSEKIAYSESRRNFIFANFARKSFSTATRCYAN